MELSVILPCLNEAETVAGCIEEIRAAFARDGIDGEIILADNGSTDGSIQIAEQHGARVVHVSERGYGSALLGGMRNAKGNYFLFADADGSYDFSAIGKFLAKLREGHDLVIGCRLPCGGGIIDPGAMPFLHRYVGTPALSLIGRILFKAKTTDYNCGMRAISREAFERLDFRTTGMEFASEMIIKANLFGLRIAEVPIHFRQDGRHAHPPHLRTFRDGWRHLRFMLVFSPRWVFFYPGALLAVLGLIGTLALLPGPLHFGEFGLDTNTLLISVMMVLLGHQLMTMGVTAKLYAVTIGMHPSSERARTVANGFYFEAWAIAGLVLAVIGVGLLMEGFLIWGYAGFGSLSYSESLRIVIPGVGLIILGAQIIFGSFLINIVSRSFG